MPVWKTKIPKKFAKDDLPEDADGKIMAATFLSNPKNPELKVVVENAEEEIHPGTGERTRKSGSGYMIRFKRGLFSTGNEALMNALIKHRSFNSGLNQFTIDHQDPTGLWQALKIVEVQQIHTFVPKTVYEVEPTRDNIVKKLKDLRQKPIDRPPVLSALADPAGVSTTVS